MTNNPLFRFVVTISVALTFCSANAALNPVKEADPCTRAKQQLEAAIQKNVAALRSTLSKGVQIDRAKAEELWNTAAAEKAVIRIRDGYKKAADLTDNQIARMAAKEVADYKNSLSPKEYDKQLAVISRRAARPDIATAEEQYLVDANAARAALAKACGNGEIQKALRIAGAFLQKRWDSMGTEANPWDKVIKFATDISMRDYRRYGLLGGKNSDARKVLAKVQREIEKVMDKNLGLAQMRREMGKYKIADVTWDTPLGGRNAAVPKAKRDIQNFLRKPFG